MSTPVSSLLSLEEVVARLELSERRYTQSENRHARSERRCARLERRFRVIVFTLVAALIAAITLPFVSPAVAQTYGVTLSSLATRVTALENGKTSPPAPGQR